MILARVFLLTMPEVNLGLLLILLLFQVPVLFKKVVLWRNTSAEYIHTMAIIESVRFSINAFIVVNSKGKVVFWNRTAKDLLGWPEKEMLETDIRDIIPEHYKEDYDTEFNKLNLYYRTGPLPSPVEVELIKKDGSKFFAEVFIAKWKEPSGPNVFYTAIVHDISHRKKNEETNVAIRESLNDLRFVYLEGEKIFEIGIWRWEIIPDIVTTTAGFDHIFGTKGEASTAAYFMRRVHGQDREKVKAAINTMFETKTGYEIEYRVIGEDATINTVRCRVRAYLNELGDLRMAIGVIHKLKSEKYD